MPLDKTARTRVAALLTGALAASLPAVPAEEPQFQELDEVAVVSTVARPLEDYVEFPQYDSVTISPRGTRLVFGWTENTYNRQLYVTGFPSTKKIFQKEMQQFLGVADVRWVSENRMLVQPDWPDHGFLRIRLPLYSILLTDEDGHNIEQVNPTAPGFLLPIDELRRDEAVDSGPRQYNTGRTDNPQNGKNPARNAQGPVRVIEARTGTPDIALLQTTRTDRDGNTDGFGAFTLNVRDGTQKRVATLPVPKGEMIVGPGHKVAVTSGVTAQNEPVVYYLPPDARDAGKDWQLRVKTAAGQRGMRVVAWTGSGEEYYALDGRDLSTRGVVIWNAETNARKLLYRNPEVDMDHVALAPDGKPWMFRGDGHFPVYWYPDPGHPLARLHQSLVKEYPDELVEITSATDALDYATVRIGSGRRPWSYVVVESATAKRLNGVRTFPRLRGTRLAPVDAIEFRARDGLIIHAYLTTPMDVNGQPRKGLPLIVIAHDKPGDAPVNNDYEIERQLLASRGYAVLQVNHRGLGGRGRAYERLGDGQWGAAVSDDFADAVQWAIQDGVALAGHACFYGSGFGALTAITAAARNPDLFQCVIGFEGVYDLPMLFSDGGLKMSPLQKQILGTDRDKLAALSPVNNARAIKAKVLLLHHKNDDNAPIEQASAMRAALKAAGNAPQWEQRQIDGMGYYTPPDRADLYRTMLRFLNKTIGEDNAGN
jgi:dipeptidyl aminopeptidase/acylaminoacyl peptidase